jgi:PhnB protein
MAVRKTTPYLNFNGTAEKAIKLYEGALGARVESIQRYGDVKEMNTPPEHRSRVMHAELRIDEGAIMMSDSPAGMPVSGGNNVHVALDFSDPGEMSKKFDALAAGGTVVMPLQDTFWGAKFGMLTDAYGINWMFNAELKNP